jgi:hypothetical protein
MIMATVATPYPQTPLEREARKCNKMPENYWRDFILGNTTKPLLPLVGDAEIWMKEIYKRFYLNPKYIIKRLSYIGSFDQLKKHVYAGIGVLFFRLR